MRPGDGVFRDDDRRSEDASLRGLPEIGATGFVPTEADTLVLEAGTGDCRRETASPSARYDHKHSGRGGHRGGDLDHQNGQDQGQGRYASNYPSSIRYSWQWMPPNDEVTLAFTLTPGASCVGSNISRFVQLTFCWLRSTRSPETFGAMRGRNFTPWSSAPARSLWPTDESHPNPGNRPRRP